MKINPTDNLQIYHTVPQFFLQNSDVAILGDVSKFVPLSNNRIGKVEINRKTETVAVDIVKSTHSNMILKDDMVDMAFCVDGDIVRRRFEIAFNTDATLVLEPSAKKITCSSSSTGCRLVTDG